MTIPKPLKAGRTTVFGVDAAYCPLSWEEKYVENKIAKIRLAKMHMRRVFEKGQFGPGITVNDVLDQFLDRKAAFVGRLRRLGYAYVEDEEDHPHYAQVATRILARMTQELK